MSLLRHILHEPSFESLVRPVRRLWTALNDFELGIDTEAGERCEQSNHGATASARAEADQTPLHSDAVPYETPDYWYVRRIARMLADNDPSDEVFFDLGCGKGRILCVMARWPYKKVVGVELSRDLGECATNNAAALRRRRTPVEVRWQDAAVADLSAGTVFFLFNPFGRDTLRHVCQNIERSLRHTPRRIRLVYYNAVHEDVLESCGWLTRYHEFTTHGNGLRVGLWQSC